MKNVPIILKAYLLNISLFLQREVTVIRGSRVFDYLISRPFVTSCSSSTDIPTSLSFKETGQERGADIAKENAPARSTWQARPGRRGRGKEGEAGFQPGGEGSLGVNKGKEGSARGRPVPGPQGHITRMLSGDKRTHLSSSTKTNAVFPSMGTEGELCHFLPLRSL